MASVREVERLDGDADLTLARLRLRLSDGEALEARLEAHRLSWETGHGLERTPPLKVGAVPDGVRLTTRCPEAIAMSVVGHQAVLASWGHTFEVSAVAPWMEAFFARVRRLKNRNPFQLVPETFRAIAESERQTSPS